MGLGRQIVKELDLKLTLGMAADHQDCPLIGLVFHDALPSAARQAMVSIRDMDQMASKAQEVLRLDPAKAAVPMPASVSAVSERHQRQPSCSPGRSPGPTEVSRALVFSSSAF